MGRIWMIAEDDSSIRSSLAELLTMWEVEPLVFEDGDQAWEWLDKVERGEYPHPLPEVALLDVMMPGKLGYEIGRRMRRLAETKAIPILIMTALDLSEQDHDQIHEAVNPERLIRKPFLDLDELRSFIENTIAGNRNPYNQPSLGR